MSKMSGGSLTDNENVVIFHLKGSIIALGKDKAISLSIHGLGSQSTGNEEYVTFGELGEALGELKEANLDASVFLGTDAFTA